VECHLKAFRLKAERHEWRLGHQALCRCDPLRLTRALASRGASHPAVVFAEILVSVVAVSVVTLASVATALVVVSAAVAVVDNQS
jgi:hypothetical protein